MNRFYFIIVILLMVSCVEPVERITEPEVIDSTDVTSLKNENRLSLNFQDSLGLKQGKWISNNKQNEQEEYTYRNDTLNGYYRVGNDAWRKEGFYKNGTLDSIQHTYEGKKVKHISNYKEGIALWQVSFDGNYIIPLKDFIIRDDTSIYIKVPYPSGQIWYEGRFYNSKQFKSKTYPMFMTYKKGTHKVYYENGIIRGVVDYDKKKLIEYDSLGRMIYNTGFNDVKTHHQVIENKYME